MESLALGIHDALFASSVDPRAPHGLSVWNSSFWYVIISFFLQGFLKGILCVSATMMESAL